MTLKLGIVELHHPCLFGYDATSTPNIMNHFMVYVSFDCPDKFSALEQSNKDMINRCKKFYQTSQKRLQQPHPTIRNYQKYINDNSTFEIKIFKMDLLSGGEYVGYPIGSFWLKILQRTWKNKYKLLVKRKKFNYLKQREICGF